MKPITLSLSMIFLLGMMLTLPCLLGAQKAELDSLRKVFKTLQDTSRVTVAIKIAQHHFLLNKTDSAAYYTTLASEILKASQVTSPRHEIGIYTLEGNIANQKRLYDVGLEKHQKVLEIAQTHKNKRGESTALSNLGTTYLSLRAYDKALTHFYASLDIDKVIGNVKGEYVMYTNIAAVMAEMGRYEEAKAYRLRVLNRAKEKDDWYSYFLATASLGGIYKKLEMIDSAYYYETLAYEKSREVGNTVFQSILLKDMARTLILKKNFEKASNYVEKALELIDTSDYSNMAFLYNYKAEASFGLNQTQMAMEFAEKSYGYAKKSGRDFLLNNAYLQLYEFNKKQNNLKEALSYHELYMAINDSIFTKEKINKLQNIEIEYRTTQKEAEIRKLKQDQEIQSLQIRQRNLWLLLLGSGACLLGLVAYFIYRQRMMRKELELMQSEQRLLRTQMNPHFFFHALSSIQQFILKEADTREAVLYLSKFSRLMRNVLEGSRTEVITLGEEIESISHYIELQQLRYGDRFDFKLHIDEELEVSDWAFPPMLLQPIIENAIEHGLIPKKEEGQLYISFKKAQENLEVIVEDNGIGRKETVPGTQPYRKSVALSVMKERIQLINKREKDPTTFSIVDLQDEKGEAAGTKVIFTFPLKPAI